MKRYNVILDLDETLVSAKTPEELENIGFNEEGFNFYNMDKDYIVFERPNLQSFLDWLFTNYNVLIWSAGSKEYVLYIIDKIILLDKKRELKLILFSDHCNMIPSETKPKNLDYLLFSNPSLKNISHENTVIIDDLDKVYDIQPENCIPIKPFNVFDHNSLNDIELYTVANQINEYFSSNK